MLSISECAVRLRTRFRPPERFTQLSHRLYAAGLSTEAKLLFNVLLIIADDMGHLPCCPERIRDGTPFISDFTLREITHHLEQLEAAGFIEVHRPESGDFIWILDFPRV